VPLELYYSDSSASWRAHATPGILRAHIYRYAVYIVRIYISRYDVVYSAFGTALLSGRLGQMGSRPREASQSSGMGESIVWMLALVLNTLLTQYALEASNQLQSVSTCLAPYYMDAIMYQSDGANGTLSAMSADEASANEDWMLLVQYLNFYSTCELVVSVAVAGILVGSLLPSDVCVSSFVSRISLIVGSVTMIPIVALVVSMHFYPPRLIAHHITQSPPPQR
jgi:hypothetical protein